MRTFLATIILSLTPLTRVFAHEGEMEITNLAEAEWAGPLTAILIILVVIISRVIRRSKKQIINNN